MNEDIIHFVWKHSSALFKGLKCYPNGEIEVISPGEHNFDSGPDFFNAKVKIGNTIWAGNVEIHVKSSDWNKHKHNVDEAYNNVILHVVANNDVQVKNAKGDLVPTLEINYPDQVEWELHRFVASENWIPCADEIKRINSINIRMWLSSLCVERLEHKTYYVNTLVDESKGNWEEAFYISMARSFGLKINALPFELLAKATPLKLLAKVKNSLFSIEAILFGQAGMLECSDIHSDDYRLALIKEYNYQREKFHLKPIPGHLWKFMRLRPSAFPTIRISQFAKLINSSMGLFSRCMEAKDLSEFRKILRVGCSSYWDNHFTFGNVSSNSDKILGDTTVQIIILNTVVPFMFAYGIARDNEALKDKALTLLEGLKPEVNSIIKGFSSCGVKADSAFFSQALVHLKSQYCNRRKCLFCRIGANVLLKRINAEIP
jgi:hypothetical protein